MSSPSQLFISLSCSFSSSSSSSSPLSPIVGFVSYLSRMSIVRLQPLLHRFPRENTRSLPLLHEPWKAGKFSRLNCCHKSLFSSSAGNFCCRFNPVRVRPIRAGLAETPLAEAPDAEVVLKETFPLKRTQTVEGKVLLRLDRGEGDGGKKARLVVGCNLEGKWVLHWGVTYSDNARSEWDQPPLEMIPPGSIPIKDYAIETPLKKSSSDLEGHILHEVQIDLDSSSSVSAIHFVLKEEETGACYQHRGRDFKICLMDYLQEDEITVGGKKGFGIWPGTFNQISSLLLKSDESNIKAEESVARDTKQDSRLVHGCYEECSILKEEPVQNVMTVSVRKSNKLDKNIVHFDTDIPGEVVVHWGVCRDGSKKWEIPTTPHPPDSKVFRKKALQTLLQPKANGNGSWGLFSVDKEISGVLFVLKLNEYTWLNNVGSDFYIPLLSESTLPSQASRNQTVNEQVEQTMKEVETTQEVDSAAYTDGIINEIRNLVTDISSEKRKTTKSKEAQENILQEIEKLAAEAYSIFRSSIPVFVEEPVADSESLKPPVQLCSGTGSGYEILCQGFNWESHKSGQWYSELYAKATELSMLGFTVIWLPPPTESVSPEGYMPRDLYNLNSRYGNMEELKNLVKRLHEVGIKVLGDVVLNHRCAHYQNKNGVWNIFGGRLNWDDSAIVADDPHFQGRGNKSNGDNFHAAPNIDHSQEFVRKDLKEWLCWLRKEIGYDGWRLDFVRGFWGGYVKDYLDASGPHFAVGEYWDSLSYTYGQMDHNQDAHRQRIIDWINATNGTAGAFDVTTKGILHSALGKCEYWRLSDEKGKVPGVMGWWPSRAVTFIENHDTGSTQGHWRFPSGKEVQGYAYILTHPGTPTVFYDHLISHHQQEISTLISLRCRTKLHCRSTVKIAKAERDVYAAVIDEKVAMKIGPGYYEPEPPTGHQNWSLAAEGKDYKVWESS